MVDKDKLQKGKAEESDAGDIAVQLPIEWHSGPEIITRYANQATIQRGVNEFHISFFEVRPPILLGASEEEMQKKAEALTSIRAECVARVVIARDFLPTFIQALQTGAERAFPDSDSQPSVENSKKKGA
jgi:hypothetical protein